MINAEVSEADQRSAPQSLRRDTLLMIPVVCINERKTHKENDGPFVTRNTSQAVTGFTRWIAADSQFGLLAFS